MSTTPNSQTPAFEIQEYYSDMVNALVKNPTHILTSLSPTSVDLWHATTGVSTEAGELLDAAKKYCIYNKPLDRTNVIEELGDLEFYMEQVRQCIGVSRSECLLANISKLAVRYNGFKYSDDAAISREDKKEFGETK